MASRSMFGPIETLTWRTRDLRIFPLLIFWFNTLPWPSITQLLVPLNTLHSQMIFARLICLHNTIFAWPQMTLTQNHPPYSSETVYRHFPSTLDMTLQPCFSHPITIQAWHLNTVHPLIQVVGYSSMTGRKPPFGQATGLHVVARSI